MASVSGAAGFDSATLVDQLMQLEAVPQTRLSSKKTSQQNVVSALQKLKTQIAALATAAEGLAKPASWTTLKSTSTNPLVTVTAGATASPTSLSVTVDKAAASASTVFGTSAALSTGTVTSGTPVILTAADGATHDLSADLPAGGATLQELAAAINAKKAGVTATTVHTGNGAYQLLLTGGATGAGSAISLTGVDALGTPTAKAGNDAEITLNGSIKVTSKTNTFTDLMPGINLTLSGATAQGGSADIAVAQDPTALTASVKGLVEQMNAALSQIDTLTAGAKGASKAGLLAGDATARNLRSSLINTVFGAASTTTLADVGIQTDRYGKLVFNETTFQSAVTTDPAAVTAKFTGPDGWATRVQGAAKTASDSYTGTLTGAITSRESTIKQLSDNIDAWDRRLDLRRSTLSRQFTALETALATMSSQSTWLTSQIAGLPTYS